MDDADNINVNGAALQAGFRANTAAGFVDTGGGFGGNGGGFGGNMVSALDGNCSLCLSLVTRRMGPALDKAQHPSAQL